jgi:hypothetical protein
MTYIVMLSRDGKMITVRVTAGSETLAGYKVARALPDYAIVSVTGPCK